MKPELTYHTFYGEFKGSSPDEVVKSLYEDSRKVTGLSFGEWWEYQKNLWEKRYKVSIPAPDTPDASQQLLDIFLKVGALEEGPQPKK